MRPLLLTLSFFILCPALPAETVRGTVVDSDGNPVAGAEVFVISPLDLADTSHKTQTAADGSFELDLSHLDPKGTSPHLYYSLVATQGEMLGLWVCEPGFWTKEKSDPPVKIAFEPTVLFPGRVVDENDKPIADARVGLHDMRLGHDQFTDAEGRFQFRIPKSQLEKHPLYQSFCARKDGYALGFQPLFPPTENSGEQPTVVLRLSGKRKNAIFRVVDTAGKPIPEAFVSLSHLASADGQKALHADIRRKTDSEGVASFDLVPDWAAEPIMFHVSTDKESPANAAFDPKTDSGKEIQVKLAARVRLAGTIRNEDGTPLVDTVIHLASCYVQDKPFIYFTDGAKTDAEGKFEFFVYPDLVYGPPQIFNPAEAGCQIFGKESDYRVVFPNTPISDFDFVVRKTYKIRGQVLVPSDFDRATFRSASFDGDGNRLILVPFFEGDVPQESFQMRQAIDSQGIVFRYVYQPTIANSYPEFGKDSPIEYEALLPKGRFTAGDNVEPPTFDITGDEPETVVDLTLAKRDVSDIPSTFSNVKTITGKVFRKDSETIVPIAGAIVEEERDARSRGKATSDENGEFTLTTSGLYHDPAIFARTDDFTQAGFMRFKKDGEPLEIELVPAASLKARLVHPKTGKPLANVKIECTGPAEIGERVVETPYANGLTTDEQGRFTLGGFMVGTDYQLGCGLKPENQKNPDERDDGGMVGFFLALDPGEFDAGDIMAIDIQSTNQMIDFVFKPFRSEETAPARFEKTLLKSKESKKPVLVLFTHANDNEDNEAFMRWIMMVTFGIQGQKYLAGYEYLPIDVSDKMQAAELADKLGVKLPEENAFTIVVCDSDGRKITQRDSTTFTAPRFKPTGELETNFDPVLLLTFLREFGKH